jgi:hypothetical protein
MLLPRVRMRSTSPWRRRPVRFQLDAAVDLGEAFREVDKSARRLPKTLDLTGIALGELRPRQLDAIRDLRALGSATNEYLTALLKSGASADEVRKQAAGFRTELEAQLRQAGLTEDAIRQYVEAATLAPDQIETAIKLSGVEQARFKLNAYLGLLEGKIPPEVATSVITAIEAGDLDGAAKQLKTFADTNPVAIDLTPTGVDKLEEAVGTVADLPRVFDPLVAATGGYSDATLDALDSVLGLGDAYKDTLSQLASDDPSKAIDWAAAMREEFAKTVAGLNLTEEELDAYYRLLGIAPEQVETAVKISISDAELFALTTTIDLLTSIDSLSPEVQLQLSSALLEGDYEGVRALLERGRCPARRRPADRRRDLPEDSLTVSRAARRTFRSVLTRRQAVADLDGLYKLIPLFGTRDDRRGSGLREVTIAAQGMRQVPIFNVAGTERCRRSTARCPALVALAVVTATSTRRSRRAAGSSPARCPGRRGGTGAGQVRSRWHGHPGGSDRCAPERPVVAAG